MFDFNHETVTTKDIEADVQSLLATLNKFYYLASKSNLPEKDLITSILDEAHSQIEDWFGFVNDEGDEILQVLNEPETVVK